MTHTRTGGAPGVSIGLPVRNGERFLSQALASLLGQSYEDFELIVSDNASDDRTASIVAEAAARDSRVRLDRSAENLGAVANFNRVLGLARGEHFMWAACDDLWEPDYVKVLAERLAREPQAVLAFCDFDNIDEAGASVRTYPHLFELLADGTHDRLARYLGQAEYLGKANLIYGLTRREALVRAGGFTIWSARMWGVDMLAVYRLLSLGPMTLSDRRLFHKRLVAGPPDPASVPPWARLGEWREGLLDWKTYFRGYEKLSAMVPNLRPKEADALRSLARARYRGIRAREVRSLGGRSWRKLGRMLRGK